MSALSLPLAHAAHWYFIPLYVAPALLILGAAIRGVLKERRRARDSQRDEEGLSR